MITFEICYLVYDNNNYDYNFTSETCLIDASDKKNAISNFKDNVIRQNISDIKIVIFKVAEFE